MTRNEILLNIVQAYGLEGYGIKAQRNELLEQWLYMVKLGELLDRLEVFSNEDVLALNG